jgi:hypothetical protein
MCLKVDGGLWLLVCWTIDRATIRELKDNVNSPEHPVQRPLTEAVTDSDPTLVPAESDNHHSGRRDCHLFVRVVYLTHNRPARWP